MREIKFRVWEFHKEEMNYNLNTILFEMTKRNQYSVNVDKEYGNRTLNVCDFYLDDEENEIKKDYKDAELMQFTGLTDRNGKEIYEGDILAISGRRDVMLQAVTFDEGFYCTDEFALFELTRDKNWSIEVIGNIYEHPHLLEGVK